jgi:hypothetical protein
MSRVYHADMVLAAVASVAGIRVDELPGPNRHWRVVLARELFSYVMKKRTTYSYPDIARLLHRPNHSTVVTACKRVHLDLRPVHGGLDTEWLAGRTYGDLVAEVEAMLPPLSGLDDTKCFLCGQPWHGPSEFPEQPPTPLPAVAVPNEKLDLWRAAMLAEYHAAYARIMSGRLRARRLTA